MEIVHIAGHSCAGKRSLIKLLIDLLQHDLHTRFGISGTTAIFFRPYTGDIKYDTLPWLQPEALYTTDVVHALHKWQFATQSLAIDLRSQRSNIGHRAIALWRTCEDMVQRINKKGWWKPAPTLEVMKLEMLNYLNAMDQLEKSGISVEFVDASSPDFSKLDRRSVTVN